MIRNRFYVRKFLPSESATQTAANSLPYPSVCFFSHTGLLNGGAERSLLETVVLLRDHGYGCFVFLPFEGPLSDELANERIPYAISPYQRWTIAPGSALRLKLRHVLKNLVLLPYIVGFCRRHNFDVYYTNTITIPIGAVTALLLGRKHIWHIRELGDAIHGISFVLGRRFSIRLMDRLSRRLLTNSEATANAYAEHASPDKLRVAYQMVKVGQHFPAENQAKQRPLKCIIVGTLQPSKGQDEAIRAISILRTRGVEIELCIVGTGADSYREHLLQITSALDLNEQVHFAGFVGEPLDLIASHDLLLTCSRREAFGRVTVEAMKLGKPVIGARSGATAELIRDGCNGYLYEPGDTDDLAAKLAYFNENRDHIIELGRSAKTWADVTFSLERYGKAIMSVIDEAAGNRASSVEVQ